MTTATKPSQVELLPIRYSIADARISELRVEFTGLAATTKEGYEQRKALEAERKVENERIAKIEEEGRVVRKWQQDQQEKIDTERRSIAAEKERLDRIEFERMAKIQAEQEAAARARQDRIANEAREKELAAAWEKERLRVEAMRPDVDKIHTFGEKLRELILPSVESQKAKSMIKQLDIVLEELAVCCEEFKP